MSRRQDLQRAVTESRAEAAAAHPGGTRTADLGSGGSCGREIINKTAGCSKQQPAADLSGLPFRTAVRGIVPALNFAKEVGCGACYCVPVLKQINSVGR